MKTSYLSLAVLGSALVLFTACSSNETTTEETADSTASVVADGSMSIDTAASNVMWKGTMVGMYDHSGDVKLNSGNVTVADGKVTGGTFEVNLKSIVPTDKNYKPEEDRTPEKLVGHLSSNDFFNVEEYPTATFEITGSEGTTIMGNLTVRGKTNPEKVENVTISEENGQVVMTGDLTFDRTKYDVSFKHPMQEMVLSNDIELAVKLVAAN
ncbi:YceI family protein [Arundinibacter roseus]|uniref:YceI family protein n=1 Tax=Arundinibacter roseus TaxID=2070510 RepID=A0A4R4KM51_9BACT|nr:YceI family protein [Arundinibacter roseus]TDB68062.1 YceI family protein [Arundinibacter roseus]